MDGGERCFNGKGHTIDAIDVQTPPHSAKQHIAETATIREASGSPVMARAAKVA